MEAKVQPDGSQNLVTKEMFEEMVRFDEFVMNQTIAAPIGNETADLAAGEPPTMLSFHDLCL